MSRKRKLCDTGLMSTAIKQEDVKRIRGNDGEFHKRIMSLNVIDIMQKRFGLDLSELPESYHDSIMKLHDMMDAAFPYDTTTAFSNLKILIVDVKPSLPLPSTRKILDYMIARQPIISYDWVSDTVLGNSMDDLPSMM